MPRIHRGEQVTELPYLERNRSRDEETVSGGFVFLKTKMMDNYDALQVWPSTWLLHVSMSFSPSAG